MKVVQSSSNDQTDSINHCLTIKHRSDPVVVATDLIRSLQMTRNLYDCQCGVYCNVSYIIQYVN